MQVHSVKKDSAKIFRLLRFSYSTAHEQLDSPRVSHASTRTRMRVYSREYTRVLTHVHAGTRTCTRSRSNACTRFTRSGHTSLVPKPSTFFRGGRGLGIDAIDTRSHVLRALVTRAHTREYSHASSEGVARVRLSSHSRVDRQVARERHCTLRTASM